MTRVVSGLSCNGEERSLVDCEHDDFGQLFCPGEGRNDIAGVLCTDTMADLEPDLYQLMTSAYLEDKPLFLLQCAMEENCLSSQVPVSSNRRLMTLSPGVRGALHQPLLAVPDQATPKVHHRHHQLRLGGLPASHPQAGLGLARLSSGRPGTGGWALTPAPTALSLHGDFLPL